jgi:hypothetical protein
MAELTSHQRETPCTPKKTETWCAFPCTPKTFLILVCHLCDLSSFWCAQLMYSGRKKKVVTSVTFQLICPAGPTVKLLHDSYTKQSTTFQFLKQLHFVQLGSIIQPLASLVCFSFIFILAIKDFQKCSIAKKMKKANTAMFCLSLESP